MNTLLDCCEYQRRSAIFAINHKSENTLSVVVPKKGDSFNYLGYDKSPFSIPIGEKVEVFDDEGEEHEITRLT